MADGQDIRRIDILFRLLRYIYGMIVLDQNHMHRYKCAEVCYFQQFEV